MNISEQITELKSKFDAAETIEDAKAIHAEVEKLSAVISEGKDAINALDGMKVEQPAAEVKAASTLGEHAAAEFKGINFEGHAITTEFKAATDVAFAPTVQQIDYNTPAAGPFMVANLMNQQTMSGNSISYFTPDTIDGADSYTVAEGAKKPQVHIDYTQHDKAAQTVACFFKESNQLIEDAPRLANAINGRGMNLMRTAENDYIVSELSTTSGIGAVTATTDKIKDVADAISKVQTDSGFAADAVIMHPSTWYSIVTTRATDDQFISIDPYGKNALTLWGVPVHLTTACPTTAIYAGAFKVACDLYRKGGMRVDIADQHDQDFVYNRVTVRIEERIALACVLPAAICKVS